MKVHFFNQWRGKRGKNMKIPQKIIREADSMHKHLLAARSAEARIVDWLRSKGYEPNDSDVFGMLANAEYSGQEFAKALEQAIEDGELERIQD